MEGVILDQHQQQKQQDGDDDRIVMDLPPGFRFHPTDEEIITHYLTEKVINTSFSACAIAEVDLNKSEPWDLPSKAKMGEKEYYFFCQRDRKYPTGMRTNRATEAGYWKATGKDKEIYAKLGSNTNKSLIGMKKTLVFYKGRAPKGEKSNWVMHEYRLEGHFSYYNLPKPAKDEWVVCRVFHKSTGGGGIKKIPGVMLMPPPFHSSRDDFLANYYYAAAADSSSLPPLMDPHPHPPPAGSSSFAANDDDDQDHYQDFKAANNNITSSSSSRSYYQPHDKINSNNNYPSGAAAAYLHHRGIIRSNTNTGAGVIFTGTRQDPDEYYCKVEQFSSNNQSMMSMSCRSQDTGLSTDNYVNNTNTEISSSLAFEDLVDADHHHATTTTTTTTIAELDSFCWDY